MPSVLKKYIAISMITHFMIGFLVWWSPSLRTEDKKPHKVTWVKLSKGDGGTNKNAGFKNSKTLPKSTVREQKKALKELAKSKKGTDLKTKKAATKKKSPIKPTQQKTAKKAGIKINKGKKRKPSRISDALARIDQQLQQREVDMSAAQARKGESGQSQWGNEKGSNVDPALVAYHNAITRKVRREWKISKSDFTEPLVAKIVVMIDAHGNILKSQFQKTSGNGSFDASAMRAVRQTAPFPVPPQSVRKEALTEGFLFEFNPHGVSSRI